MKVLNQKPMTVKQAIKEAKKQFRDEHMKRAYKPDISVMKRYGGGIYILVLSSGLATEFYFD